MSDGGRPRGGGWLVAPTDWSVVDSPERLSDEQRLVASTVRAFVDGEVLPALDQLERQDWARSRDLVRRAGALGLLGVDVAEAYGGQALDKTTSMIVGEGMGPSGSFAVTFGVQANLVMLALSLFGTEDQQRRYLPGLMRGDLIGAYSLSEAGAGSDALGARARATGLPDGRFVLNGEKLWTSNGGFADLFVLFAKVDGERFTAFLVERGFGGVTSGAEERKMGLHGSSTTALLLDQVVVPANNVLGEVGRGHKVAFTVLNFARLKLGAACVGTARHAVGVAARYAGERRQFGRPIAAFGAIRHKLGEMTARAYAAESLLYRTAGLVDRHIRSANDPTAPAAAIAAFEEFAIESSLAKVAASEALDFVLDENIQIHGGNGYVRGHTAERLARDARVNRIFEGTSEINRLLAAGLLRKRSAAGALPVDDAVRDALDAETATLSATGASAAGPLDGAQRAVEAFRRATLLVTDAVWRAYGDGLAEEQEAQMLLADMMIDTYAAGSAVLRAADATRRGLASADRHAAAASIVVSEAAMRLGANARRALAALPDTTLAGERRAAVGRLLETDPINTVTMRRQLADAAVAGGAYPF